MNRIERIDSDKEQYLHLLLEADPDRDVVMQYLPEGELYVMFSGDEAVCAAVVTQVSADECELKNIACARPGQGFGSGMIAYLCRRYKPQYRTMLVGTADASVQNIRFYEKNGFAYSHTVRNFFIDNYSEPIYESGRLCVDMVCMRKEL